MSRLILGFTFAISNLAHLAEGQDDGPTGPYVDPNG
jgi:hypothetical protein